MMMKGIMITIKLYGTAKSPRTRRKVGGEGYHEGEGGGGSGRIRLDCKLRLVFGGGVQGKGRLSRENCVVGTTGGFWHDLNASPGGRIKLSLLERKPSSVVTISIS